MGGGGEMRKKEKKYPKLREPPPPQDKLSNESHTQTHALQKWHPCSEKKKKKKKKKKIKFLHKNKTWPTVDQGF